MNMIHLEITLDEVTKQRVEAAAAEKNVSVNSYFLSAVERQLTNDGLTAPSFSEKDETRQQVDEMRALRAKILAERNGELIDVDAILELVRDERDDELYSLH